MAWLPKRQRAVLMTLDGRSPERLQDVAHRLGLSREGVRKLRQRAADSLRRGRGLCRAS